MAERGTPPGRNGGAAARRAGERRVVAVVGNPNTGKSTLFNALTGLRQKVANYPGVTVEKHLGSLELEGGAVELVDLPGMYSLAAHSPDELVALDVLLGRVADVGRPDAVLVSVDASNLARNLYLLSQVLELGLPVVVALNMVDLAERRGIAVDAASLGERMGATVVPVVARKGTGLEALKDAVATTLANGRPSPARLLPWLSGPVEALGAELAAAGVPLAPVEIERALLDSGGAAEARLLDRWGDGAARLALARDACRLAAGRPGASLAALEAQGRYRWIGDLVAATTREVAAQPSRSDRLDRVLGHPLWGSLVFVAVMATLFQAVFAWAAPVMEAIDAATGRLGEAAGGFLPEGALRSLVVDGVFAGVGSVVVFLPQILVLFTFILVLEDSGYMARAAFLMDRLMRGAGLSGQSFIPMLSSFACAVPGILGTRVIPDRRDRLATILAAPFMTCSARLPVYALLIAAFVPATRVGPFEARGLTLLALYLLGVAGGVGTALLLKRTVLRGPTPTFLMELPPYRWPSPRSVLTRLWERAGIFLRRAGTVIFSVAVVVWALAYFPRSEAERARHEALRIEAKATLPAAELDARLAAIDALEGAAQLEASFLGRLGHGLEPAFRPLGWDWRVASAALAAFPAREVVIAVLGTIYAVGGVGAGDDAGLVERLEAATWPNGEPVFGLPMALGLMVFFAFCLQCTSTVAVIRRETASWRWPLFAWTYMTAAAWVGAFVVYRLATAWLG